MELLNKEAIEGFYILLGLVVLAMLYGAWKVEKE